MTTHPELDALTADLPEAAEELRRRAEALVSNSYPPGRVEPVYGGWRVCLPGRMRGATAQLAHIYPTKRAAVAALRQMEGGRHG